MKKMNISLIIIGSALIILAVAFSTQIPIAANGDFNRLVQAAGGSLSHTADFPDTYKQISANSRMLQNFYIGATGLICLTAGLFRKN